MANKKNNRRALFMSVISMILCCAMLIGTTFAWFTDSAASGLNKIVAGNLDVELLYKNDGMYENAMDAVLFDDVELWEPGMVVYETIKVANKGTLALKYALEINTGNENTLNGHALSEVLHFAVLEGEVTGTRADVLKKAEASANKGMLTSYIFNNNFSLKADQESAPTTLVVYWPASTDAFDNLFNANNGQTTSDGQALHIDLGLTVYASQESVEVEQDSFNEYYDDTAGYPENMWLGDVAEALVIDEENKVISIGTGAELAKLAEEVNSGEEFAGYTVKLTDSIDLGNIAWTPIGGEKLLKANVDGQGHTIYNLNVSGEEYVGLFGCIYTADITNVHVVNANVTGNHFLGAVVGQLGYGDVTNCSVTNAKIIATPNASGDSYDNGDKVGGITGQVTEGSYEISGNKAENVYLKAYRDVGGIVGMAHNNNTVTNNTVSSIDIVVDQATNAYGDNALNAGGIFGREGTNVTSNSNNEVDVVISYVVATETALNNAIANGSSVTLGADIAIGANNAISIPEGKTITLDLNNNILSATSDTAAASCAINNKGQLTIKNGTVTYQGVGDPNFGYGTNTINNTGKLTIEDANIINTTNSGSSVAIDCSAGAELIVNSGNVKSEKNAIRLCPFGDAAINATINDGTITGARAVQIQLPSNKPESAPAINLTVNGGALNGTTGLSIYSYSAGQSFANVKVNLNGGTYNNDVAFGGGNAKTTTETVSIKDACVFNADAYRYITSEEIEYIVSDGKCGSSQELNFVLSKDGNVVLTDDITLDVPLTIASGMTATIDLNGHVISQEKAQTGAYAMIENKGTLTIKDSVGTGKISYADTTTYSADNNYASNTIRNEGTLNIEGGTIENVSSDNVMDYGYPHAIDVYQGSTTNISGGTVKSANYDSIRMFCNSTTLATTVNISGGNIVNRVSFQNPGSNTAGYGVLNITGGTFTTTDNINANVRLLNFSSDVSKMDAKISGGSFDKGVKTQNYGSGTVNLNDWLTVENVAVNEVK